MNYALSHSQKPVYKVQSLVLYDQETSGKKGQILVSVPQQVIVSRPVILKTTSSVELNSRGNPGLPEWNSSCLYKSLLLLGQALNIRYIWENKCRLC